jgi:hypothetical protein
MINSRLLIHSQSWNRLLWDRFNDDQSRLGWWRGTNRLPPPNQFTLLRMKETFGIECNSKPA